ncbi:hypothetical protein JI435_303530 [Parastagonospora nodorum SN15]|uniref:Uncharacterized protein n=1 Tax=Phaeosphaeria nodorum (strain SN15 / ATCC MYA-4574 / FGSC 10173) TaxID=321614 RepID=A0A7U2FFH1_PHANO|nr:hypothetical protein JI435_303530 [Parastagonospora nodorum SN15]
MPSCRKDKQYVTIICCALLLNSITIFNILFVMSLGKSRRIG